MTLVLGVDIGLKGGLALLHTQDGRLAAFCEMPLTSSRRGKQVIDARAICEWIRSHSNLRMRDPVQLAVIEDTHSFGTESRSSCFSFGRSTGRTEAVLELLKIPLEAVAPQTWKAEILKGTKKDKAAALGHVLSRYPSSNLPPKHDGIADAICLAEYARRHLLGAASS